MHDPEAEAWYDVLAFFVCSDLNMKANELLLKADRCRHYNPAWSRNLERKAAEMRDRAWRWSRGKTPTHANQTPRP